VAAATSSSDRIGLQRAVGGGGETSGRRGRRDGTAAAAPRATPDGPPTDSEHAECRSMVDIQSAAAEIRRGKKEEDRRRKKPPGKNIMVCPIT